MIYPLISLTTRFIQFCKEINFVYVIISSGGIPKRLKGSVSKTDSRCKLSRGSNPLSSARICVKKSGQLFGLIFLIIFTFEDRRFYQQKYQKHQENPRKIASNIYSNIYPSTCSSVNKNLSKFANQS